MPRVSLVPRAGRQLRRLSSDRRLRVSIALKSLANDPKNGSARIRTIDGHFRRRVDDLRLIFRYEGSDVSVVGIERRDSAYSAATRRSVL